jgi:hypothetical protein
VNGSKLEVANHVELSAFLCIRYEEQLARAFMQMAKERKKDSHPQWLSLIVLPSSYPNQDSRAGS